MDSSEVRAQESLTKKDNMVKLVHDVADMEVRAFSMREAAKKLREDAEQIMIDARGSVDSANNRIIQLENDYIGVKKENEEMASFGRYYYRYVGVGCTVIAVVVSLLAYVFLLNGLSILIGVLGEIFLPIQEFLSFGVLLILPAVFTLFIDFIILLAVKRKHKEHIADLLSKTSDLENALSEARCNLVSTDSGFNESTCAILKLRKRAEELDAAAAKIDEKLNACYSLGIVQHSYQNLVCVVVIDAIFLNDKADTMREAMLLCDTELRHHELINKLNDIYHSLSALAMSMQRMSEVLDQINYNIRDISKDVYKIANEQERIAYAAESIKRSADNADFYISQRRAGAL